MEEGIFKLLKRDSPGKHRVASLERVTIVELAQLKAEVFHLDVQPGNTISGTIRRC